MSATAGRRAHRWFWVLATAAVCASGALYEGLRAAPGPATGLLVLTSALVLVVSAVQAARILALVVGRPVRRLPRWHTVVCRVPQGPGPGGFTDVENTATRADGLHTAIVRATKPLNADASRRSP
ncbi:hypothetical protein ACWDBO_47295 [Streptomyces mirabilis]|uniref:hypothetical protein n=1 Tax=Streptomyces TaxID=1883 RepID=UPI0029AD423B|nr:hypothetical protein [Streptomyces sp. AK02-04a]MDX3763822.1 hypothetical protein [Streptomyces sp. AK02-04a]